jgi:predicted DNA-binding transcriptional regulator AlpA
MYRLSISAVRNQTITGTHMPNHTPSATVRPVFNNEPSLITATVRYISPRELCIITGLSQPTIWRMRRRGELPEPTRLSPGRVGWRDAVIESWLAGRSTEAR